MDDITLLATILQGEAAVLGPAGMTAVAAVFVARMLSPAFPSTVSAVAPPFYGRAIPGPTALYIAADALTNPANYSVEFVYCFSAQDRRKLGLPPGDRQLIRSRTWQLHLYKEDPLAPHHAIPAAPATSLIHGPTLAPHQDTRIR